MKKNFRKIPAVLTGVFAVIAVCIILYAISPFNPRNVTDKDVVTKGTEYTVKVSGISEYDENGFLPVGNGFHFGTEKMNVFVDEEGFAYTEYEKNSDVVFDGKYSSAYVAYSDYTFCGENFSSTEELQAFFDTADRIYDFDIDKLSYYIQDIINYEKKFNGEIKVKIYRGRCVITELYIGGEKVMVHNDLV